MQFASAIADALGIELPAEKTRQSLFLFIGDNMPRFKEKRSADRHNAGVYAVAYDSENPDPDDWMSVDAMGIDPLTGGFADNH